MENNNFKEISNISLLLTEDCNFRCEYCFIDKNPSEISLETAKDAVDWLVGQNENDRLHINFFGGEPMLKFDLIKKIVLYAENNYDRQFGFGVTTNGSLFNDERLDFFEEHNMSALFSIDGIEEVHNRHRKYKDGSGTFKDVEENMKKCVERGISRVGRPTYTPETLPHLYETVKYLLDEIGFKSVSPTPAVDGFIEFTEEDYEEYDKQWKKINKYFKDSILMEEDVGLGYYSKCFRQHFGQHKMQTPCGAGKKYVGINHKGDIFPCHRFVQWQEWKLGDVYDGIKYNQRRSIFHDFHNDDTSEECRKCDNKFCGGGCFAVNYSTTGDIHKTSKDSCKLSKLQWDNAMDIYEELKMSNKFQQKYSQYIENAPEEIKEEIGYNDEEKRDNKQSRDKQQYQSSQKSNDIEELKKRVDNLEQAVSSISNIILENSKEEGR